MRSHPAENMAALRIHLMVSQCVPLLDRGTESRSLPVSPCLIEQCTAEVDPDRSRVNRDDIVIFRPDDIPVGQPRVRCEVLLHCFRVAGGSQSVPQVLGSVGEYPGGYCRASAQSDHMDMGN